MSIKRIIITTIVIAVPLAVAVYSVHYMTFIKKQHAIEALMMQTDSPYYKGLASVCYNQDHTQYKCCLASVENMISLGARMSSDGICAQGDVDQLKCAGSYKWCSSEENAIVQEKICSYDADCVPASCCHATETVNVRFAPDCKDLMCTMSCETILDCGRGVPVCVDGVCAVKPMNTVQ